MPVKNACSRRTKCKGELFSVSDHVVCEIEFFYPESPDKHLKDFGIKIEPIVSKTDIVASPGCTFKKPHVSGNITQRAPRAILGPPRVILCWPRAILSASADYADD